MDKITSKLGVVSLDAPTTRLPVHTDKTGPDAVWDMVVDVAAVNGYTIDRKDYDVSGPYTPEDATSSRVTRVDITNKSDRLFRKGSKSHIYYSRHDLGLVEDLRYPYSHSEFTQLLNRLNTTSGLRLTESDFDMDSVKREDGIWTIKASSDSYYWIPGSGGELYDRGGWTKIASWFDSDTIPDLRGLILNLEQPTWDVRRDAVNYIQSNRAFDIPWNDLIEHPLNKNVDGSYRYLLDRKPLMEYIEPQWIQYRKLTLSEYMHHPGAAVVGAIPFDRQGRLNFSTKNLFNQAASGTGSGGYISATDTFFVDTTNKAHNRINIPTDFVGVDWKFLHGSIAKIEFTSTYRKGRYWFKLGGETPDIGSFVDNPIPELDRKNILGISEEASDIPLRFEYFLDFSDVNVPLSTLFINGEFIWEGPITRKYSDNPGPSTGEFIFLAGTSNQAGTHSRLEITDFNLHVLPLGSPKESSYVQVNASVTELVGGTIYENLPRLNEFYKVHLTEENVEDGPLSTTEPTTLVARDGDAIIEAESEFIVDTAPNLASVFLNTDLDGFDGWDPLGPGQQVSYIGYEYPDGRHTRYMGRVQDTELFTAREIADQFYVPEGGAIHTPYASTEWFKYQLDGELIYVPMKPLFGGLSYTELKRQGVVNRSGDHLARVPANTKGNYKAGVHPFYRNKTIEKDGRVYVIRMIKGLNQDGPMLPYVVSDPDDAWTHDSEWNRLMYNLTAKTILPQAKGDEPNSQRGPKWEYISAADMVVENNGAALRYTLSPEMTIEGTTAKAIYRGGDGVTYRGRQVAGILVPEYPGMGFRPMLRLLTEPEGPMKLIVRKMAGFHVVDYHPDTDLDYCHDTEVHVRLQGESEFTRVPYFNETDGIYLLLTEAHMNAEVKFIHSNTMDVYETETLVITEELLGEVIDHSQNGPGPALPTRLRYSDDVEGVEIAYFGRVSKEEFFSSGELRSAVGLTAGEEMDCVGWFKFSYCGDICYVPERPVTHTVNMNQLRDAGLRSGKAFTHEGQEYSARVLRGTRFHEVVKFSTVATQGDPITHRQTYAFGSEWNELYYRLSDVSTTSYVHAITNDTYPVHVESQFERMTYDDLLMANNQDPGTFNLVYEDYAQDSVNSAMYRGAYGMSRFSNYTGGAVNTGVRLAFRPIVYLNRAALKTTSATNNFRPLAGSVSSWSQHTNSLGNPNRNMYNGFVYSSFISLMFGDNAPTEHRTHDRFTMSFGFSRRATSPIFRYGATVTRVGDEFYIIGGRNRYANLTFDRDIYVYNPSKDTYRKAGVFPVDISFHTATEVEGVIYIIGGHDGMYNTTAPEPGFNKKYFYTYDTVTGVIVDQSDREGLMVKYRHQTQYYNGKFYIFAGNHGDPSFIDVFDLKTGEFSRVDNPLHGLEYGYTMNNATNQEGRYMYVVAGWSVFNNTRTNRAYEIDLETLTYRTLGNLPSAKSGASVMSMHGQIYVPAGWNGSGTTNIFRMGTMYDLTEANRVDD